MEEAQADWCRNVDGRLCGLEKDVAVILSNYVTKEDLARVEGRLELKISQVDARIEQLESRLIKWFVSTSIALAAISVSAAIATVRLAG
ncbi:hypothetical protein MJ904_09410 [Massilia sp. MB5]|uniref:hypothetical protein n=1 Tax=Massilia sp. MB5 TaxID=2919578 RepID=UPI001F0DD929|nr:hypothetical protein [Massilia sp. MB5]UMR32361.1 hypothetical protein MJ904_09410 [Massilia sp. MB5]